MESEIKRLFKEAALYQKQGLLDEARQIYEGLSQRVQADEDLTTREDLARSLQEKLRQLDSQAAEIEELTRAPRVSSKAQGMIRSLFAFSPHEAGEERALREAIALFDFGQHEAALGDLYNLLTHEAVRVQAAEHILRCLLAMDEVPRAVGEYRQWLTRAMFSSVELQALQAFFEAAIEARDDKGSLAELLRSPAADGIQGEHELLDFSFLEITLDRGPLKGMTVDIDVSYQTGTVVKVFIPMSQSELLAQLQPGSRLSPIRFFSPPQAFLNTSAVVLNQTELERESGEAICSIDMEINAL